MLDDKVPKRPTTKPETKQFESVTNFTELYALLDKTTIGQSISHRIMTVISDSQKLEPHRQLILYTRFMTTLVDPAIREALNKLLIVNDPVLFAIQCEEKEKTEKKSNEIFIKDVVAQRIRNLQGMKEEKWEKCMADTLAEANMAETDHPGFLATLSTAYEEFLKTTKKTVQNVEPENKDRAPEEILKEVIANAEKVLEENRVAREQDNLLLSELYRELGEKKEGEAFEFEKDRAQNPFKYELLRNLHPTNFKILFGVERAEVSFTEIIGKINHIMSESGKKIALWKMHDSIKENTNYAVEFSSNGFYLRLKNETETPRDEKGLIKLDSAKFELYSPNGQMIEDDLDLLAGQSLLKNKAEGYQTQQLALFEGKGEIKNAVDNVKPSAPDTAKREANVEQISTSEKIGSCFVEYCKTNTFFDIENFIELITKLLPEAVIKSLYLKTKGQTIYFHEKLDDSSYKYTLITSGSNNYLLPQYTSSKDFEWTDGFIGSATPDKLQKFVPAELFQVGKGWEIKTPGQLIQ